MFECKWCHVPWRDHTKIEDLCGQVKLASLAIERLFLLGEKVGYHGDDPLMLLDLLEEKLNG